ncbi:hypothetical protein ACFOEY_15490 [Paracandidimonas soli]
MARRPREQAAHQPHPLSDSALPGSRHDIRQTVITSVIPGKRQAHRP